jgi:hypothetical protein
MSQQRSDSPRQVVTPSPSQDPVPIVAGTGQQPPGVEVNLENSTALARFKRALFGEPRDIHDTSVSTGSR